MSNKVKANTIAKNATVSLAAEEDVESALSLVNRAYRGTDGWTQESSIVAGDRVAPSEVRELVSNQSLYLAKKHNELIGCFVLSAIKHRVFLGMLVSSPEYQNTGLGKWLIAQAVSLTSSNFEATELNMWVISQRTELIEYYERRGFKKTGTPMPYPSNSGVGTPIIEGLTIQQLSMGI